MKIEKKLFFPSLVILFIIIIAVMVNLDAVQKGVGIVYNFCISYFGWLFIIANITCMIFSLWIMFGPYKNIRLGGEKCKPAFKTISWAGMMFTTSCGAWLVVYGFLEPIYCAADAPFQIPPLSTQAYEYGQMYAHFHWGPNAWCIYVPISVAVGYVLYNRKAEHGTISEVCKVVTNNMGGKIFSYISDLLSVCGTVIAPVISIGTGMPLLVALVETIFNIPDSYRINIQIGILLFWIIIFGTSVYLGLQKGVKRLSNINIILAFLFMAIIGIMSGVLKIFSSEINTIGLFFNNYARMCTYTDPYGTGSFVKGWTVSYWACYFVYMPLMGIFNAKISKGRRLKEIAFGQLILCTAGCWVAMATFGNYAMNLQIFEKLDIAKYLANGDESGAILAIMQNMPLSKLMMIILLFICFIFLATTMDSSAFSVAEMTIKQENGENFAPRWLRVIWALIAAIMAFVLLQIGGAKAVRSLCYITGLPLAVISFFVIASVIKMIKQDYGKKCEDDKELNNIKN